MSDYTRPERCAERAQARRKIAEIARRGGCACCKNRDKRTDAWGRSGCMSASRSFPLCLHTPGLSFDFDDKTIEVGANES